MTCDGCPHLYRSARGGVLRCSHPDGYWAPAGGLSQTGLCPVGRAQAPAPRCVCGGRLVAEGGTYLDGDLRRFPVLVCERCGEERVDWGHEVN